MSKYWLMILSLILIGSLFFIFRSRKTSVINLEIKDRIFNLEVASTIRQHTIGLMNRESMPQNHGMIFVFGMELPQSFWMKNTLIPLDIIFLDKNGTVINIAHGKPQSLDLITSLKPAKYVIELNAGISQQINLLPGDSINLPW